MSGWRDILEETFQGSEQESNNSNNSKNPSKQPKTPIFAPFAIIAPVSEGQKLHSGKCKITNADLNNLYLLARDRATEHFQPGDIERIKEMDIFLWRRIDDSATRYGLEWFKFQEGEEFDMETFRRSLDQWKRLLSGAIQAVKQVQG